jgi:hypothetical protein
MTVSATIGGTPILPLAFDVTGSSFGSCGHASITTSLSALGGLDLFDLASSSAGITEIYISIDGVRVFGGEHLFTSEDFDNDTATIHARSWAGALMDQKRILTQVAAEATAAFQALIPGQVTAAGISNENQKIGDIVTAIAQQFGFTPILGMTNGNPLIGTIYGEGSQTFMPSPKSLWAILTQLARDTGYVVYDTPDKRLVFGEPGANTPTLTIGYESASQSQIPSRAMRVEHHPRRNSTFRVLVIAYDPSHCSINLGRASYVARNFAGSQNLAPGLATGQQAAANETSLAQTDATVSQVPLYTFHHDGLTQEQADTYAGAIATDIAKRELILSFTTDGQPLIEPTQKLRIIGNVPSAVSGTTFYTSGFTHRYKMPRSGHAGQQDGFVTEFKALNIPVEALAAETAG